MCQGEGGEMRLLWRHKAELWFNLTCVYSCWFPGRWQDDLFVLVGLCPSKALEKTPEGTVVSASLLICVLVNHGCIHLPLILLVHVVHVELCLCSAFWLLLNDFSCVRARICSTVGRNCSAQACCLSTGHLPLKLIDLILGYNEFLCLRAR